jgi:hypothetical protein
MEDILGGSVKGKARAGKIKEYSGGAGYRSRYLSHAMDIFIGKSI